MLYFVFCIYNWHDIIINFVLLTCIEGTPSIYTPPGEATAITERVKLVSEERKLKTTKIN